jgi:hypothetical protein
LSPLKKPNGDFGAVLNGTAARVGILERHVEQLRADQREIRTTLGETVTKHDLRIATEKIGRKIDGGVSTVIEAVLSLMGTRD